jgi:hypothetical protein
MFASTSQGGPHRTLTLDLEGVDVEIGDVSLVFATALSRHFDYSHAPIARLLVPSSEAPSCVRVPKFIERGTRPSSHLGFRTLCF